MVRSVTYASHIPEGAYATERLLALPRSEAVCNAIRPLLHALLLHYPLRDDWLAGNVIKLGGDSTYWD